MKCMTKSGIQDISDFFTLFLSSFVFFAFQGLLSTTYYIDIVMRLDSTRHQILHIFLKTPPQGNTARTFREVRSIAGYLSSHELYIF